MPHGAAVGVSEGDLAALRPRPRGGVPGGARAAVQPRPHLRAHAGNTGVLLVISNTGFWLVDPCVISGLQNRAQGELPLRPPDRVPLSPQQTLLRHHGAEVNKYFWNTKKYLF